jgi:anti-anti-sigma factor
LNILTSVHRGVRIVRLDGELDLKTATAAKEALGPPPAAAPPLTIVNVAKLSYVDSAGLTVFIAALKAHAAGGGRLVFAELRPEVRHILQLTRLLSRFTVFPSEAEALAALSPA